METNLIKVKDAMIKVGIVNNGELVGLGLQLLLVDNTQVQEMVGLADITTDPLRSILTTKRGIQFGEGGAMTDPNLGELTATLFESRQAQSKSKIVYQVSELPQNIQEYLNMQMSKFKSIKAPVQEMPQAVQTPVPQAPVAATQEPVVPQVPVAPAPVIPQVPVAPAPVIQTAPGITYSDNPAIQVGARDIHSIIDPETILPEYMGVENGQDVFGPERITEEEFIAIRQIRKLVKDVGLHLLNTKENNFVIKSIEEGKSVNYHDIPEAVNTLYELQDSVIAQITTIRKQNRNSIEMLNKLTEALEQGTPFDMAGKKFSFLHMAPCGDDGEPIEGRGNPLLRERALKYNQTGKKTDVKRDKPVPRVNKPLPVAGTSGGAPVFKKPKVATQKKRKLTCQISKFLSLDGTTPWGIVMDINGKLANGNEINGTFMNSYDKLTEKFNQLSNMCEFNNADIKLIDGEFTAEMSDLRLNALSLIPAERFVHPKDASAQPFISGDKSLLEIMRAPKETVVVKEPVGLPQPAPVLPEVQPVTLPQPAPTVQPPAPVAPTAQESDGVAKILEFVRTAQGSVMLSGISDGQLANLSVTVEDLIQAMK